MEIMEGKSIFDLTNKIYISFFGCGFSISLNLEKKEIRTAQFGDLIDKIPYETEKEALETYAKELEKINKSINIINEL